MGKIDFTDLNWENGYKAQAAYGQSKLANLLFTYELQRRLAAAGKGTLAVAAHPGWTETNLQAHAKAVKFMNRFFAQDALMGALPGLYAATDPSVHGAEYIGPSGFMEMNGPPKKVKSNKRSHRPERRRTPLERLRRAHGRSLPNLGSEGCASPPLDWNLWGTIQSEFGCLTGALLTLFLAAIPA